MKVFFELEMACAAQIAQRAQLSVLWVVVFKVGHGLIDAHQYFEVLIELREI